MYQGSEVAKFKDGVLQVKKKGLDKLFSDAPEKKDDRRKKIDSADVDKKQKENPEYFTGKKRKLKKFKGSRKKIKRRK